MTASPAAVKRTNNKSIMITISLCDGLSDFVRGSRENWYIDYLFYIIQ